MSCKMLILPDFPRGQRIIQLGQRAASVEGVVYRDTSGCLARMDPPAYLFHVDRLILARDVWPRTCETDSEVAVYYTTA